jgi:hypothetical protein
MVNQKEICNFRLVAPTATVGSYEQELWKKLSFCQTETKSLVGDKQSKYLRNYYD